MSSILNYKEKYHVINPESNSNKLFSSFNYFKSIRGNQIYRSDERPPYPVLISDPTINQVLSNMNKSDFLVYSFVMSGAFLVSVALTRNCITMTRKLRLLHLNMHFFNLIALTMATSCSFYRLTGFMDNGLRWRRSDGLNKYDFTSDMESKSIFKYFRERV
jgi:hypothetical protein